MEEKGSTTQLKKVLGFWDLLSASIGQIIGAGIMTLLGAAISMTGRSIPFALITAAVITICYYIPFIFISGTVRLRGGQYTMVAMMVGKKAAGAFSIIWILCNLCLSMYGLSFASYFISLFGFGNEQLIAFIVLTLFYFLNCFGIDKFAKSQKIIVALLVIALVLFAAIGVTKLEPNYYSPDTFFSHGMGGFLQAAGLLTFATSGGSVVLNLSGEAKHPTRDIPLVMIVSTLLVAILYAVVGVVAAGVLPLHQVEGQNLAMVANAIFTKPLYVFFIICGAGFALISTLNAQLASSTKPIMQACDDGWLPACLAKLSKRKSPVIILTILYGVAAISIFSGLSVAILGNICNIASNIALLLICAFTWRLPDICPEEWNKSKFKVSTGVLKVFSVIGALSQAFNIYLNASSLSIPLLIFNILAIAASFVYGFVRSKKAHIEISYEGVNADFEECK
jgi:APA family basic amino acid/polyamine antiporter